MSQITWDYLAGFFDGEGYIRIPTCQPGDTVVRVEFSQSAPRIHILILIDMFLSEYGISSKVYVYGNHGTLKVFRHDDVVRLLTKLAPKLILKRARAEEALALLNSRQRSSAVKCKRGHLWAKYAVVDSKSGKRQCKQCRTELMRGYRAHSQGGE